MSDEIFEEISLTNVARDFDMEGMQTKLLSEHKISVKLSLIGFNELERNIYSEILKSFHKKAKFLSICLYISVRRMNFDRIKQNSFFYLYGSSLIKFDLSYTNYEITSKEKEIIWRAVATFKKLKDLKLDLDVIRNKSTLHLRDKKIKSEKIDFLLKTKTEIYDFIFANCLEYKIVEFGYTDITRSKDKAMCKAMFTRILRNGNEYKYIHLNTLKKSIGLDIEL